MWGRRWDAGGMRQGAWQEPSAGPWRHGEMANIWQAASNAGSGERSKNFLIHQRTHLGLGQAPQWLSLCTCVCVLVLACERHKCKNNYENFAGNAPPHNNNNKKNKNSEGRPAKSQNQMWKMFQEGGAEGRKKNFLLGPLVVEAVVVVLMFFFIGYCRRFCFHVFIAMLRAAKKPNKRVGGKKRWRESVREGDSNKAKHLNLHNFRSTSQM